MPTDPAFDLLAVDRSIVGTQFHGHLHHLRITGSTNQLALEAAAAGLKNGVWIADEQTAGRGRGGHSWHSAPGNGLYVTALVTPEVTLSAARWFPMRTGLAVQAAVRESTGLELDLRWPNDLMFADRKCGGILVESGSKAETPEWQPAAGPALRFAVIGIGLNLRHPFFPPELASLATSLYLESGLLFDREPILAAILRHLDAELGALTMEDGPDVSRRFTASSSWVRGKRVRVGADSDGRGGYTGLTRGLDSEGHLRVQDDEGQLQTVVSGNVRAARE